jgi:hypothetical protein
LEVVFEITKREANDREHFGMIAWSAGASNKQPTKQRGSHDRAQVHLAIGKALASAGARLAVHALAMRLVLVEREQP